MAGPKRRILSVSILLTSAAALALAVAISTPVPAQPASPEPIAYIGHGAMFDAQGREILPTPEFIEATQAWYFAYLSEKAKGTRAAARRGELMRTFADVPFQGQERLLARQAVLYQILLMSGIELTEPRMPGKVLLVGSQLKWVLPTRPDVNWRERDFKPSASVDAWMREKKLGRYMAGRQFLATSNTGQAYIDECQANQVPIPPPINQMDPAGTAGWKIEGLIPQNQQFIIATPAQLRSFRSSNGVCIALPRFTGASMTTVALDGVICQSSVTSKVCFWDNQRANPPSSGFGEDFQFGATQIIPIGVPISPGGLYQAGGREIEFGDGGVCTDCHAGENPYIVHPDATIRTSYTFGDLSDDMPLFAPGRYDPIAGGSWPMNNLSHSPALTPPVCTGCHVQGGNGRLPHLSNQLGGYCGTVLRGAVTGVVPVLGARPPTMPQGSPGSLNGTQAWTDFNSYCGTAPAAGPSNRGDPHLVTTNEVSYDFQAAGEFTALRNSGTRFELQTRQTPVVTSFIPGANPYTGLQSCVSLNTAAAMRLGRRRITFQADDKEQDDRRGGRMVLRIDGKVRSLPADGLNVGGGNRIVRAGTDGAIDVRAADGTRVIITPIFWSSQGYWYLDIEVLNTPAREGTLGPILGSSWLPFAPDGSSWGPRPGPLLDRHIALNQKFADVWRVTNTNSLFDYAPGTSTATFTDRDWPSAPGGMCSSTTASPPIPAPGRPRIQPMNPDRAASICRKLRADPIAFEQCVFDATVMGDPGVPEAYARTLSKRLLP